MDLIVNFKERGVCVPGQSALRRCKNWPSAGTDDRARLSKFRRLLIRSMRSGYASAPKNAIRNTCGRSACSNHARKWTHGASAVSLGGHGTLFLATFDESGRWYRAAASTRSRNITAGTSRAGATKATCRALPSTTPTIQRKMPLDFGDVLLALAPRPLFINVPIRCGVFGAADRLVVIHTNAGHSFCRRRGPAYGFLDRWLKGLKEGLVLVALGYEVYAVIRAASASQSSHR